MATGQQHEMGVVKTKLLVVQPGLCIRFLCGWGCCHQFLAPRRSHQDPHDTGVWAQEQMAQEAGQTQGVEKGKAIWAPR